MIFNRAVNLNSSDKGFNPTYEELEKLKMNAPLIFGPILNKLSQIDLVSYKNYYYYYYHYYF